MILLRKYFIKDSLSNTNSRIFSLPLATPKWDSKGIKRMISGILPTNRFVYYDTRELFGYVTELLDNVPPPPDLLNRNKLNQLF